MVTRRIAVVTTSRADYGIYRPVLRRLNDDPSIELVLFVGGMHLLPAFGMTVRAIEADGFPIAARIDCLEDEDSPAAVARAMARATHGFAEACRTIAPDMLVVLGDRFEMHAAAVAAQPFRIPLAHIHGGELTLGAMDDALRHSITKLSHLHFTATEPYARRVMQLGEEDWRVTVSGAPGLDNLEEIEIVSKSELSALLNLSLDPAPLMVTYHPEALADLTAEAQGAAIFAALEETARPCVFTAPNADAGGRILRDMIEDFVTRHPDARFVENLGTEAYFGLMAAAAAMVGNSSSGMIEAASFALPVVNIGNRQEGRMRPANVIDTPTETRAVIDAIRHAICMDFRDSLAGLRNPYRGDGPASAIIHRRLASEPLGRALTAKRFVDRPG